MIVADSAQVVLNGSVPTGNDNEDRADLVQMLTNNLAHPSSTHSDPHSNSNNLVKNWKLSATI